MRKLKELDMKYSASKYHNCFVGYSHDAPWRDDIISVCETVLPGFGLKPWYADDQFKPTKSLREKVVEMIATARYAIYDISQWRRDDGSEWILPRNVLIELGMAIAFNRPVLLLRHAENRAYGLKLSSSLAGIGDSIIEFSGEPTLKHALEKRLPQWIHVSPEQTWLNRFCLFGQRVCPYREVYPQAEQWKQDRLCCHISDGPDIDRIDFRSVLENELERYSDVTYTYLDTLPPSKGYDFLLCSHCQSVRSTPFAVYRITPHTPAETFIAIGMSIALETQFKCEIPRLLFTVNAQDIPSLLKGYDVVEAVNTKERKKLLRKFLPMVMHQVRESAWRPHPLPFEVFIPPDIASVQGETEKNNGATEYIRPDIPQFKVGQEITGIVVIPTDKLREQAPPDTKVYLSYEAFATRDVLIAVSNQEAQGWKAGEVRICLFVSEAVINQCVVLKCEPGQSKVKPGYLLRLARAEHNWTQQELADQIGTTPVAIGRWERGETNPTAYFLQKLCEALGKSAEELGLLPIDSDSNDQNELTAIRTNPGEALRRERQLRGWSQKDVAEKISTSPDTVNGWENGRSLPRPYFRQRLCELYQKSAEELGFIPGDIEQKENVKEATASNLLSERLRRERQLRGWSQADLAAQLGTDPKTISRWESRRGQPQPAVRQKLIELFGINAEELGLTPGRSKSIETVNTGRAVAARVGANIREVRTKLAITQAQLAGADYSVAYISAVERGKLRPSLKALSILARRLDVPLTFLLEGSPSGAAQALRGDYSSEEL